MLHFVVIFNQILKTLLYWTTFWIDCELLKNITNNMTDSEPEDNPYGPNKLEFIVDDNRELRNAVKLATMEMKKKYEQMLEFYERLKVSARNMSTAYSQKQAEVDSMRKQIALLKADNFTLSQRAARTGVEKMNLGPSETNGTPGQDEAVKLQYEETVSSLAKSLRKAEADLEENNIYFREQWQNRELQFKEEHKKGLQDIHNIFQDRLKDQQAAWDFEKRKYEEENQAFKSQVMQLLAELKDNKKVTAAMEDTIGKFKNNSQITESRIYQLSKEFETTKERNRILEDDVVRLKHDNEEMQRQKVDKEKSLDELFEVYNKEREDKYNLQQELDKYMALYLSAEETIKRMKEDITKMKKRAEEAENEMRVYKQQAEIFKRDFEMERGERQKIHDECGILKNTLGKYQIEMQKMKQEVLRHQDRDRSNYGNYGHG